MKDFHFQCIGRVRSCFTEKFGIPRQPGLANAAEAVIELFPPFDCEEACAELRGFSHVWVVFVFHQAIRDEWKPTVRPPRLGGNQRIGVFASRSPFRPNPIGMSAVELQAIECDDGHCRLLLRGADLLDGTPVLDIKPYVPYTDALPEARGGFAAQPPEKSLTVGFTPAAAEQCAKWEQACYPGLALLIEQVLGLDPRPAYCTERDEQKVYGMRLYDLDVKWVVNGNQVEVLAVVAP